MNTTQPGPRVIFTLIFLLGLAGCYAPQAGNPIPSFDGARLYRENCAACHGQTGAGDGPMVPQLATSPSSLRSLAARNQGNFPRLTVTRQIDGRDQMAVHGSREMPVWGWQFTRAGDNKLDPAATTRARIDALVDYLQTIQD